MKAALQHVVAPGWYTQHDDVDIDTKTGGHMVVSEADAAAHFVIANMRWPCDYWLSKWSYLSDLAQLGILAGPSGLQTGASCRRTLGPKTVRLSKNSSRIWGSTRE